MILVAACLVALLSVPLTGGRLSRLGNIRVRSVWLIWASVGVQIVITQVIGNSVPLWLDRGLHLVSYAMAGVFLVLNRRLPGALLICLGGGLNLVAIVANGGTMPASAWAWRTSGLAANTGGFENSDVVHNARLLPLGDVMAIPKALPLANVFSIGDVILVVAITYFVHRTCRAEESPPSVSDELVAATPAS